MHRGTSQAGDLGRSGLQQAAPRPLAFETWALHHLLTGPLPALTGCAGASILPCCHQFSPNISQGFPMLPAGVMELWDSRIHRCMGTGALPHCQGKGRWVSAWVTDSGMHGGVDCVNLQPRNPTPATEILPGWVWGVRRQLRAALLLLCKTENHLIVHLRKVGKVAFVYRVVNCSSS